MRPCFASLIVVAVSLHASAVPTTNSNGSVMIPNSELTRNQLVATDVSGLLSSESDPNVVFTNGELLVHGERVKIGPDETEVQEIASAVVAPVASSVTNLSSSVSDLQSSKADRSEIPGNYLSVSNKAMTAVQAESDPTVYAWAKQPNPPAETDPTVKPWAKADKPPAETDPTVPAWAKQATPPQTMTTNAVDALANSAVVTNALTVATTNRVALLESSKADNTALTAHVANTNNPHAVTAAQVGAVPLVEDAKNNKTAVTIGSRTGNVGANSLANGDGVVASGNYSHAEGSATTAAGDYSHAEGSATTAAGDYSHAEGVDTTAAGNCSHAEGCYAYTKEQDSYAFAWNGDWERWEMYDPYNSHGAGTFNINPAGGLNGFYIGEQTLGGILALKADKSALDAHVADTNNPHAVTAAQVGAVPLVEDAKNNKTAVTIGSRTGNVGPNSLANGFEVTASGYCSHAEGYGTTASGYCSHAEGYGTTASGYYSHAEGYYTTASGGGSHAEGASTAASGDYSHAEGVSTAASGYCSHAEGYLSYTRKQDQFAFAWNGDITRQDPYNSHGEGTFNINPVGGLDGFWIGEQTLHAILTNKADKADISATDPTFSNAVLAVGLNIDTNSVAVLNDIAATFGGFPLGAGETATTVGGLLAALAAAIAWLKKNKVGSFDNVGGASATVENGVAKLNGFFTESNSLLTGTIAAKSIPAFSSSSTYEVGEIVIYDGVAYKCVTAITPAEEWTAAHWTLATNSDIAARLKGLKSDGTATDAFVTSILGKQVAKDAIDEEVIEKGTAPDAHLEAPTDDRLKLILADNSVAYDSAKALPYKLTSVIGDRVIATMTLTAASTDITLPTIAANDTTVKDFILDVTNAYAVEGVATDAGINIPRTDFKLVTRDGESLTAVTTVKAGKSAFICFTQKSPVVVDGTTYPCWCVIQLPFGDPS